LRTQAGDALDILGHIWDILGHIWDICIPYRTYTQELRTQAGDALDIHHPWSLRLLLVEADGRGATEVLDERFFATVLGFRRLSVRV